MTDQTNTPRNDPTNAPHPATPDTDVASATDRSSESAGEGASDTGSAFAAKGPSASAGEGTSDTDAVSAADRSSASAGEGTPATDAARTSTGDGTSDASAAERPSASTGEGTSDTDVASAADRSSASAGVGTPDDGDGTSSGGDAIAATPGPGDAADDSEPTGADDVDGGATTPGLDDATGASEPTDGDAADGDAADGDAADGDAGFGVAGGDGASGDDEDYLPAGQTALVVGDEVVVDDATMRRALEAILMVTDEPLPVLTLARAVGRNTGDIAEALAGLAAEYTEQGRGFDLREIGGGWRFYTRPEAAQYVERFVLDGQQARLTQAALETLAVVAYKQPVSRARVSAIRGVNVDGVMRTLVARGLVEEAGADTESQATLYRTTTYFLERMGMQSLDDLPELAPYLPEMDDIEEELAAQTLPPTSTEADPEAAPTDPTSATDADADLTRGASTEDAEQIDEHAAADAPQHPENATDEHATPGASNQPELDERPAVGRAEQTDTAEDAAVGGRSDGDGEADADGPLEDVGMLAAQDAVGTAERPDGAALDAVGVGGELDGEDVSGADERVEDAGGADADPGNQSDADAGNHSDARERGDAGDHSDAGGVRYGG
ncbi:hypothetical protein GCM10009630_57660 [Kribbella jejuensis]|uniref:Segregation and condensation protein B n=1 Tax=Kribbella jejuensis TaxID=236068 RepID=A0A542ENG2_9ACTN|nr:segregation and condensation protein B [Kribbella jejuensis]